MFVKPVHLVGFTIGIYYDARTYERQIPKFIQLITFYYKAQAQNFYKNIGTTPKFSSLEGRHAASSTMTTHKY